MKFTSRFARIVGVTSLATLLVAGLAACGVAGAKVNEDYLVLAKVKAVNCSTVASPKTLANKMQATANFATAANEMQVAANFVTDASPKQTNDILALNKGLTSLAPLKAELNAKIKSCGGTTIVPASDTTTTTLSPELKALLDAANAPLQEFSCVKIVTSTGGTVIDGSYTLFVNTILKVDQGNPDLRQWSDALSTPLKGMTAAEMRTWINRAICEEPVIGVSLAHLFAHLQIEGVSVLSLQTSDWLKPFAVDASQINDLVGHYTPLTVWRLQNPSKQDIPDDVYVAAVKANHAYQEVASRLVFLLSRYQLGQVMNINSTHHYHLVAGGLTADNIPEVEISTAVDSRPSVAFFLTEKTACKPISVLGFNTGDKRPMLGAIPQSCASLKPPVPSTPSQPHTPSSGCTVNCGGTPGCTSNCMTVHVCPPSAPHGTWPVCKDDPSRDPQQQGNNKPGGGGQAPAQTDPVGPPAGGSPSVTYTPPPAPQPVHTTPPVVIPAPQPSPAPTVDPSQQPTNNGTVPGSGGPSCNPEFQSC